MVKNWIILGDAAFDAADEPIAVIRLSQEEMSNWAEHSLQIIESARTEKINNFAKEMGGVSLNGLFYTKNKVSDSEFKTFCDKVSALFEVPLVFYDLTYVRAKGESMIFISFFPSFNRLISIPNSSNQKCTIMSLQRTTSIKCPTCNKKSKTKIYDSLNISLDPDEKAKLLNGELFQWECPHCHESFLLDFGFIYHDMEKRLMIYFRPAGDDAAADEDDAYGLRSKMLDLVKDSYSLRTVHGIENLQEKIRIFDAGLNDVVIEYFKLFGTLDADENRRFTFYFDRIEDGQLIFHGVDYQMEEEGEYSIPYADYLKAEQKVNSHKELKVPKGKAVEINRIWLVLQISQNPAFNPTGKRVE